MKKAIGQTVRELKRGVNKKVLKVPGIEQKILDATSNEPWGPHGSLLADIAQASRNHHEYQMIMSVIWKRINDTGKNWRHVYKALTVLEYLVAHGSERVLDDIREHAYQISTLSDFKYIDTSGRDQGNNVRRKSQTLVALVNDKERIKEVREKALANRDKYRSTYSTGGKYRPVYGDRCDAEHSESFYSSRDEDRNRYGRERNSGYRDDDRYDRGGESYNRDRDRYGRDSFEQSGRESYHDDDCQGDRGNDDHFGSGNRNYDRDRARSFDEDTRYASRDGSGGRADDYFQDERRLERNLSELNVGALHDYEGTIRDTPDSVRGDRDGGVVATHTSKASSPATCKPVSPESTNQGHNEVPDVPASAKHEEADEFDPRGSTSAAPPASSTCQTGFFGDQELDPIDYLALIPVTPFTSDIEADLPTNTGYGSTSTSMRQPIEEPFGASPFKATPQEGFPPQRQHFAPTSFQSTPGSTVGAPPLLAATTKMENSLSFDFGGPLGGLTYAPTVANGQRSTANSYAANGQQSPGMQVGSHVLGAPSTPAGAASSVYVHGTQPSGPRNMNFSHPVAQANFPMDLLQQPVPLASQAPLTTTWGSSAKTNPPNDKFETKSTVWAETLSRGLVNLNISGVKINPLADIGIDFESINRMEKRKQDKSSAALATSTVAMGKAMGAGSGIGRAAGNGVAPPSNPMMGTGSGRGIAGGAGMGMGIGYGGSMNQAMGMNQGSLMRPPIRMPAGTGMPGIGSGYNPMMRGMGSYGSQHPYGSGNK